MNRSSQEHPRSWKKRLLKVICVILALILLLMLGVTVAYESFLNRINRVEGTEATLSEEEASVILATEEEEEVDPNAEVLEPEEVTVATSAAVQIEKEELIHILLVGQDRRPGEGRQRSDSMILCTINKETKTLTMTSFLRDMYVMIPGYYHQRLNVAYPLGGFKKLNETLAYNFGVQADHNIEVDFGGFVKIVDLMGGVSINLTQNEAGFLNKINGWSLRSGVNHLNGEEALAYSRIRKIDSDFARTNRQRTVLTALLEKCRNMDFAQLYKLIDGVIPMITTDMTNADITNYIMELFPILPELQIVTQHIPVKGTYRSASIRGMSVYVPNLEANQQYLKESLGG